MGINVRVQDAPKQRGIIAAQVKLEKDLRDCMRCKFFYGNNSQCLAKKCVKEESKPEITEQDKETGTGTFVSRSQRSSGKSSTMQCLKRTSRQRNRQCRRERNVHHSRCRPMTGDL